MRRRATKAAMELRIRAIPVLEKAEFSRVEIAHLFGLHQCSISALAKNGGIGNKPVSESKQQRAREMEAMYREGKTLEQIGAAFNVTRERARQILSAQGITRNDSGRRKDCYVMCRKGDAGAYEIGNVYIATLSQNAKDSYVNKPYELRNVVHTRDESGMTKREREVWELSVQGLGPAEIGKRLGISRNTVAQHKLHARAAIEMKAAA